MTTLLNHLIADKVGTSAFLATIFDPGNTDVAFVHARKAIADEFGDCGIAFSKDTPSLVLREYLNIDLIVVWKPWTILIENKVTTASITGGQLNDYYSVVLKELKRNSFLKDVGASAVDAENFARQSKCLYSLQTNLTQPPSALRSICLHTPQAAANP